MTWRTGLPFQYLTLTGFLVTLEPARKSIKIGDTMSSQKGEKAPSKEPPSFIHTFLAKLRKRHIIETLAAFIAGGWLFLEFVDRILIAHYELNKKWLDVSFITLLGALLCIILWRWFSGTEKRPGNVKVEVLIVPLVILVAFAIDLNLILWIAGIQGKKLLIGIAAFLLGITWVIFKLSQWAAGLPETGKKEAEASPPALARPEKSIIVLPFVNISPEEGQDYFCDGMTEEIITDLSHVHDLLVISRSSAMTFKGTQKKLRDIAQELNVRYVLEGSVRKAGNDLRITAQLIDATNDAHLWAEKYSGTLDNVFDIQEKVSRSIVNALRLRLTPSEDQKIAAKPFDNLLAYESYLKATYGVNQLTQEGLSKAEFLLKNALAEVGDHPLLFAGLAYVYWGYVNVGFGHEESKQKAEEFARKAIALDPNCAPAHSALGYILSQLDGNQKDAIRHFKLALAHNPNDNYTLLGLATTYVLYVGKPEKALPIIEKVRAIDPFNPWIPWILGAADLYQGQYERAAEYFNRALKLDENNTLVQWYYSWTLAYLGRFQEAFSIVDRAAEKTPDNAFTKMALIMKDACRGKKDALVGQLTSDYRQTIQRDAASSHILGVMLARLGKRDEAIDWFENAVRRGFLNYPLLAEKDPWLVDIRNEPRFKKLMERVKYEWEHFEM